MKTRTFIFLITVMLILQLGVLAALGIQQFAPNLILISLVWLVFNVSLWDALLAGIIWGSILDIYSVAPFGVNIATAVVTVFALYWIINNWLPKEERFYVVIGSLVLTALFYQTLNLIFYTAIFSLNSTFEVQIIRFFNTKFVIQVLLSIAIYYPFSAICKRLINVPYDQRSVRT